jgi:hypothetical protein
VGRRDRGRLAREIIARFEAGVPVALLHEYEPALLAARAFALANEGKLDSAVSTMRLAQRRVRCAACIEALRGQVFEAAAMPDSAVAAYERYTDTGWQDRYMFFPNMLPNDPMLLALSHERAGLLYDQLGNQARARSHYGSFVTLWENAEPELRPRVQAARDRLARLSADGAR